MKEYLKGRCPICKGQLFVNQFGYQCEDCSFTIPKFICNRNITIYEAEKILQGERIILDGFSKRDGKVFSSIPVVRDSSISLDNTISQCPQLGGVEYTLMPNILGVVCTEHVVNTAVLPISPVSGDATTDI